MQARNKSEEQRDNLQLRLLKLYFMQKIPRIATSHKTFKTPYTPVTQSSAFMENIYCFILKLLNTTSNVKIGVFSVAFL